MRLDKYLAEAAIGTRKNVRQYVMDGKIKVNDQVIVEPAQEVDETIDVIQYLDNIIKHHGMKYYMFNKPMGCITARKDATNKTIYDYLTVNNDMKGIFPVGRLDKDTEGLLLLTNDGEFNHRLMHPDKHVEKRYYFWAFGSLSYEDSKLLKSGVRLGDNKELAKVIDITIEEDGMYLDLRDRMDIMNAKNIRINPNEQTVVSGYITISEGRKHVIKRMLKAVGCYVVYLKRTSIGSLILDETLKKGQYRELTKNEISRLLEHEALDTNVNSI